ncbi:MAG: transcriptional repressor LexA [Eubacterium sp.]|nr:transcriptional repressor LexA [Eubacterium sp.]
MEQGKLGAKQKDILEYMKKEILDKGYPPSVREICQAVGLKSTSSVHAHLESLELKGYIRRDPLKPRAIEIVDDEFNMTRREIRNIPMVGTVAAGAPLLAEQNITGYFPLLSSELPAGDLFMLDVKGDSMINVGIYDGDRIIAQQTPVAKNGDIVVALIDDSATVKTYYKEKDHFRLQPENDTMEPIIVPEVIILGRVVGLFRLM